MEGAAAYRFAVSFISAVVVQIDWIEDSNYSSTAPPPVVIQTTMENRCYPTYLMRLQREPGVGLRYPRPLAF
jgi:hypothetical protein